LLPEESSDALCADSSPCNERSRSWWACRRDAHRD
jgi:hypothetical protein